MATAAADSTITPIDAENLAIDATEVNWEGRSDFSWAARGLPQHPIWAVTGHPR